MGVTSAKPGRADESTVRRDGDQTDGVHGPPSKERVELLRGGRHDAGEGFPQLVGVGAGGQDGVLGPLHARSGHHLHGPGDLGDVGD